MHNQAMNERISEVIESVPKPGFVASVSFHLSEDWSGDPAIMLLVLLKDGEKSDDAYLFTFRQKGHPSRRF